MPGKTVLIGFAEALAAPEVIFSLFHAGHNVRVFTRRGSRSPVVRHLPVGPPLELTAPEESAAAAVEEVCALVADSASFDLVFALDDASLWLLATAADRLGENAERRIVNPVDDRARLALDKRRQIALAADVGLRVPASVVADAPEDLPQRLDLPAIARPALAVQERADRLVKGGVAYLLDQADVAALGGSRDLCYPLLVQPMIRGVGEGIFGFSTVGETGWWSGHRRVRMMNPHGSGSSACAAIHPSQELTAAAGHFAEAAGWRGPFMIELLCDDHGTPWFVEFNGRPWGSMALARRAGFEYPAWAIQQALTPEFAPPDVTACDPGTVRHLGRDLVHLAFVLKGPRTAFHRQHWPRFTSSLGGVVKPTRRKQFYNFDPDHPTYFLRDAVHTVTGLIKRRR